MSQSQVNELGTHHPELFEMHSVLVASEHHMTPCCMSCGKEMEFVEGDIIYGEDWYHGNCWKTKHMGEN